jgi:mRNA interferase RelE/StbE
MTFIWPKSAQAELRGIDRESAQQILMALTDYGRSGEGDVRALTGAWRGHFRLRVGDHRVIFTIKPDEITVVRVRHRSDVYR